MTYTVFKKGTEKVLVAGKITSRKIDDNIKVFEFPKNNIIDCNSFNSGGTIAMIKKGIENPDIICLLFRVTSKNNCIERFTDPDQAKLFYELL